MALTQTLKDWMRDQTRYHMTDMSRVKPEFRFSERENALYLNSCAGVIRFTSRDLDEMAKFRNIFVNRFSQLIDGAAKKTDFFSLYKDIISSKWSRKARLKYKANLRTRMRMKIAS